MSDKIYVVFGIVNECGKRLVFLLGIAKNQEEKQKLIADFREQQTNFIKFEAPKRRADDPDYYRVIKTKSFLVKSGQFYGENLPVFAEI